MRIRRKKKWSLFFSVLTPRDAWAGVIKRVRRNGSSFYGADCSLNGSFQKVKKVPSPARIGQMCRNNLQPLSIWENCQRYLSESFFFTPIVFHPYNNNIKLYGTYLTEVTGCFTNTYLNLEHGSSCKIS